MVIAVVMCTGVAEAHLAVAHRAREGLGSVRQAARGAARGSAFVRGVVIRVERDQPEKVAISVCNGANLLAQAERIHPGAVGRPQVLYRLPTEAGLLIQRVPVKLAKSAKRRHDRLQLRRLEAKQDVLELGAVEVQTNAATGGGHACARDASSVASGGR